MKTFALTLISRRTLTGLLVTASAVLLGACGSAATGGGEVSGNSLTVYSSQPLLGADAAAGTSIVRGEKLALRDAKGKIGKYSINYISLDDSTQTLKGSKPAAAGFDAKATAVNANKAGQDTKTIAYIGDFSSAATAISIPIINEGGIFQVAPAGGAVGLTKEIPGAAKGAPDIYYPSGDRNFARLAPADDLQATAGADWARKLGVKRTYVLSDHSDFGRGMARLFSDAASQRGLKVVSMSVDNFGQRAAVAASKRLRTNDPELVYFGGDADADLATFVSGMHVAVPQAKLMVPDNLLVPPSFTGKLGAAAPRTYVTGAIQDAVQLPKQGKKFVSAYKKQFGEAPDPYAVYGYSAMQVVLGAIDRAAKKGNDRQSVINEIFKDKAFDTGIGSIQFDDNGDSNLRAVPGYRVSGGQLKFSQALEGTLTN